MKTIQRTNIRTFLESLHGRIFSVQFVKKNGELRHLTGRLGVYKHVKGTGRQLGSDQPYITVFEVNTFEGARYRNVNLNTVLTIKADGETYTVR